MVLASKATTLERRGGERMGGRREEGEMKGRGESGEKGVRGEWRHNRGGRKGEKECL